MAIATQEMYGASGKVGNKVYFKSGSKTVVREKVTPKNPKTDLQTLQRVITSQVGKDYQKLKDICDHSFEGYSNGAQCSARFRKLNMRRVRERASEIQGAGQSLAQFYNFQPIGSTKWVPDACIISQGQLPKIPAFVTTDELGLYLGAMEAENTYAGVCDSLGLKRGDQLTFVAVVKQNGEYQVKMSRVILDPRNGDGSGASMLSAFIDNGAIVNPNWRNDDNFTYLDYADGQVRFGMGNNGSTLVACAIIASRKDGDSWLRSNAELVISEEAMGADLCSLYDAVVGSYSSGEVEMESEYYLNNAGTGGAQGELTPSEPASDEPAVSTTATINGVAQNVAGGSVNVSAPLNSIALTGSNLADAELSIEVSGVAEPIAPTSKTANAASWTGLAIVAGKTVSVKLGSDTMFTITVQEAQSGGGGGNTGSMTITQAGSSSASIGATVDVTGQGSLVLHGTNMQGTWVASGNDETRNGQNTTDTQVSFNGIRTGTYTITFNGSNVLTVEYTFDED